MSTASATGANPFEAWEVDPAKVDAGVWFTDEETGHKLRMRRLWCAQHIAAHAQAEAEVTASKGKEYAHSLAGRREVRAMGLASGLITDWDIRQALTTDGVTELVPRPYDRALMTATLANERYTDLVVWIMGTTQPRQDFRPDPGN